MVNSANILQSIERRRSFKQRGLRQPGEPLYTNSLVEVPEDGEIPGEMFRAGSETVFMRQDSADSGSGYRSGKFRPTSVVPFGEGRRTSSTRRSSGVKQGTGEVDEHPIAEEEEDTVSDLRNPTKSTPITPTEMRWAKVRVAAKTISRLKTVENDLRIYGAKHEEEMMDDPNDPRYFTYDVTKDKRWYILLPTSRVRRAWEVLIILMLFYVVVTVPVRVCFDLNVSESATNFDSVVDILFILDVVMNCFCAYVLKNGDVIVDQRLIILNYFRTWMVLDVLASIPFYQFMESDLETSQINRLGKIARLPKLVRLIRLLRLLKLLRVMRLLRYFNNWESFNMGMNLGITRMFKVTFGVFLVTHLIGCFWYLISWAGHDSVQPDSWVYRHGIQDDDPATKYLASVYWSFSTLTTVGFGDISARTNAERVFSIICMVVGVSWYAFVISTISSIIAMFDRRSVEVKRKQRLISEFMRETKIPWELRRRILSYFNFLASREVVENDSKEMEKVLSMLSTQLRTEVTLHVHRNLIPQVPFFDNKTPQFIAGCVSLLKPLHFQPGDYISTRGQHADEMYFLITGRAIVVLPNGRKFKSIVQGSYFGEIGCMLSEVHRVSIVAATECEICALAKQDLKDLMADFPDVANEIRATAKKRIEHLNQKPVDSAEQEKETKEDRSARNIATSFPGVSFDSVEEEEKEHLREKLRADARRGSGPSTMLNQISYGSLSESLSEGLLETGDMDTSALAARLLKMELGVDAIRTENKELRASVDKMRSMLEILVKNSVQTHHR